MSHPLILSPLPHDQEVEPQRCLGSYNRRVAELRSNGGVPYTMHFFFTHVSDFHLVPGGGGGGLVVAPGPVESCWESFPSCLGSDFLRSVERLLAGGVCVPVCSAAAEQQEGPWWGGAGRCRQNLTSGCTVEGEEFLLEREQYRRKG